MIEYPRIGMFTVGFAMGRAWSHLEEKKNAQLVNVFVPTTPNPTSGFLSSRAHQRSNAAQHDDGRSSQADHFKRFDHT